MSLCTIDSNTAGATELMFSCNCCERTLDAEDLINLGLVLFDDARTKPLKDVVINGTATGITKSLSNFSDEMMTIPEENPGYPRVVYNRETKNAFNYFVPLSLGAVQGYRWLTAE